MSQDRKFEKLWEFRRRGNDYDSSSDDSKSSSSHEPVLKKHKLVSNLILPEHDETSDTLQFELKGQLDPGMGDRFESGKANKRHIGSKKNGNGVRNKRKRRSTKEGNKKKRKDGSIHEPISIDDFKIFMESLLGELKVARENMFAEMREKMDKLVTIESKPRQSRKRKTGKVQREKGAAPKIKPRNCKGGSLGRSVKTNTNTDLKNCEKVYEEQNKHDQEIETVTSNGKDRGERLKFPADKPINSSNHSDRVVSSPYLTLPTGLSEPRVEKQKINFSSSNYIQPGLLAGNNTSKNAARANLVIDASTSRGYFAGIQPEEHFGSFAQMGSKDMGGFNKHNTPTSSMGIGFQIPLHQRLDNSFNMPSQIVQENSSCDNNMLGLRFSGGSYNTFANNFCNHMNYKSDGQLMPFGSQEFKEGRFHPTS